MCSWYDSRQSRAGAAACLVAADRPVCRALAKCNRRQVVWPAQRSFHTRRGNGEHCRSSHSKQHPHCCQIHATGAAPLGQAKRAHYAPARPLSTPTLHVPQRSCRLWQDNRSRGLVLQPRKCWRKSSMVHHRPPRSRLEVLLAQLPLCNLHSPGSRFREKSRCGPIHGKKRSHPHNGQRDESQCTQVRRLVHRYRRA